MRQGNADGNLAMKVGDKLELIMLPGHKIGLAQDVNLPSRAMAMGTIEIEGFQNIPEVMALRRGDTVVDVGAFIGDTALSFLNRGCSVYAIEPYFDAFVCLQFNCPLAKCFHAAAGNGEAVSLSAHLPAGNHGCRFVTANGDQKTLRIDDLNLQACHLIKVDCEGWELFALQGAEKTIRLHRPMLIVEHYVERIEKAGYKESDLTEFIMSLGYSMRQIGEWPRWDWICTPLTKTA